MKILWLVIFIYLKNRFGFILKSKVAKWGVNGKANSIIIGLALLG